MFILRLDKAIADMVQHCFRATELAEVRRNTVMLVTVKLTMADGEHGSFQTCEAAAHFMFKVNGTQLFVGSQVSERAVIPDHRWWKFESASGTADCQQAITRVLVEQGLCMRRRLCVGFDDQVHETADIDAVHYRPTAAVTICGDGFRVDYREAA